MSESEITGTENRQGSEVDLEYAAAKEEGRQPRCPYCTAVLGVRQVSRHETYWRWNGERFEKRTSDEVNEPYCVNCGGLDWRFIDNDFVKPCNPPPLFVLTEDDAQIVSRDEIGRELTEDELHDVSLGVQAGLDEWGEIMRFAIRGVTGESQ